MSYNHSKIMSGNPVYEIHQTTFYEQKLSIIS